jgi:hypothetical protein
LIDKDAPSSTAPTAASVQTNFQRAATEIQALQADIDALPVAGVTGPSGVQGVMGATGATGITGATGVQGQAGAPGQPGEPGDPGGAGAGGYGLALVQDGLPVTAADGTMALDLGDMGFKVFIAALGDWFTV